MTTQNLAQFRSPVCCDLLGPHIIYHWSFGWLQAAVINHGLLEVEWDGAGILDELVYTFGPSYTVFSLSLIDIGAREDKDMIPFLNQACYSV